MIQTQVKKASMTTSFVGLASTFVLSALLFISMWLKHYLFVYLSQVLCIVENFLWKKGYCSVKGRAFMRLLKISELLGVKPTISSREVDEDIEGTHYEKLLFMRNKLVRLFDDNLHLCYPSRAAYAGKVSVECLKIFDKETFIGDEKSFHVKTIGNNKQGQERTTVVYIHGGGFMCGDTNTYVNILTPWLVEHDFDAVVLDYGLCPFHTPDEIGAQAREAYSYVINKLKINPKKMVLAGDSAGANIIVNLMINMNKEDIKVEKPAGLVLLSPWLDLSLSTPSWKSSRDDIVLTDNMCRLGEKLAIWQDGEDPVQYSPLFMDLKDLPPCYMSFGETERLSDECFKFCDRLQEFNVPVEKKPFVGMFHAFSLFHKYIPEARDSLQFAADFIKRKCENKEVENF